MSITQAMDVPTNDGAELKASHRNLALLESLNSCHCTVERLVCTTGSGVQR